MRYFLLNLNKFTGLKTFLITSVIILSVLTSCNSIKPYSNDDILNIGNYSVIYPKYQFPLQSVPLFICKLNDNNTIDKKASGIISIHIDGTAQYSSNNCLYLKKGIGSILLPVYNGEKVTLHNENDELIYWVPIKFEKYDTIRLSGTVPDSLLTINSKPKVIVNGDINIPSGKTLTINYCSNTPLDLCLKYVGMSKIIII